PANVLGVDLDDGGVVQVVGGLVPGGLPRRQLRQTGRDPVEGVARQAVESASIAVTDGLTAKQIRALSDQVVAKLKERGIL
ncbi:hypothetical protein KBZ21_40905, partial [Streptomyces sp. A73]|nr:hypothetical protein [Streptomyces sp. A73]